MYCTLYDTDLSRCMDLTKDGLYGTDLRRCMEPKFQQKVDIDNMAKAKQFYKCRGDGGLWNISPTIEWENGNTRINCKYDKHV